MMDTTFIISGGIGRVICSIPALEKFSLHNPNNNFKILAPSWEHVYLSNPILQQKVHNLNQKGIFDLIKNTNVIEPEIYRLNNFFNQRINMAEAFDEIINQTDNHSDLNYNSLYTSYAEKTKTAIIFNEYKKQKGKNKIVVFQPFGSTTEKVNEEPFDPTNRSLMRDHYLTIAKEISKDSVVLFASHSDFRHPNDDVTISFDEHFPYIRVLTSFIQQCDYFVGVCSSGQHIARAFNKPGLIIMGGTNEINFSYPQHFKIFRKKDRIPQYTPWRLADGDCEYYDRMNDCIMDFNSSELSKIISIIKDDLKTDKPHYQSKKTNLQEVEVSVHEVKYE